jgi:hypothetical protein
MDRKELLANKLQGSRKRGRPLKPASMMSSESFYRDTASRSSASPPSSQSQGSDSSTSASSGLSQALIPTSPRSFWSTKDSKPKSESIDSTVVIAHRKTYLLRHYQEFEFQTSGSHPTLSTMVDNSDNALSCWLHPQPPMVKGKPAGVISKSLTWYGAHGQKQRLAVNVGVLMMLRVANLTDQQEDGYVNKSWHLSHLCGNWTCLNPLHHTIEPGSINLDRNRCMNRQAQCKHEPVCLTYLKQSKETLLAPYARSVIIDYARTAENIVAPIKSQTRRHRLKRAFKNREFERVLARIQRSRIERRGLMVGDLPKWQSTRIEKCINWLKQYPMDIRRHSQGTLRPPRATQTKTDSYYQSLVRIIKKRDSAVKVLGAYAKVLDHENSYVRKMRESDVDADSDVLDSDLEQDSESDSDGSSEID